AVSASPMATAGQTRATIGTTTNRKRATRISWHIIDTMQSNLFTTDMTALEAVSVYLPPVRTPIEDLAGPLGLTDMQVKLFRRFHGLREVGRDPDASPQALLMKAAAGLDALRGQEHRVRYVLYARAMPVAGPYPVNPLHEVCRALGLGHALAFTVTHQSCASGLLAIDMAGRLLAADTADGQDGQAGPLALVLTGEKAF